MKNKKLFAILTLVCFMFTLMPVAAFAAAESPYSGEYAIARDSQIDFGFNSSVAKTWEKGDVVVDVYADDVKLATATLAKQLVKPAGEGVTGRLVFAGEGSTSWTAVDYAIAKSIRPTHVVINADGVVMETPVVAHYDENGKATALTDAAWAELSKAVDFSAGTIDDATSTFVAEDGDQSVRIGDVVEFELDVEDRTYGPAAGSVYIWAEEVAGKASSALTVVGATAAAIDNVYVVTVNDNATVDVTFARAGEYTVYAAPYVAVDKDNNEVVEFSKFDCDFSTIKVKSDSVDPEKAYTATIGTITKAADETFELDIDVVSNNVFANELEVTFEVNGAPLKGKTIAIETNSASIEVNKASDKTDTQGRIDFKVAGSVEGDYEIYLSVDGVEWTIEVSVGNTAATYIETVKEAKTPVALWADFEEEEVIAFSITDINGNAVTAKGNGMVGIKDNKETTFKVDGRTYKGGSFVVLTEAPADSDLESDDLTLEYSDADQVWYLTGVDTMDAEGTYAVKVILDNGAYATAEWTVKKFQTPVRLIIGYATTTVELGGQITGALKYMDANGVMKTAKDADFSATGYALAGYEQTKNADKTLKPATYTVTAKSDEKYVGETIKVTAVSEKYDLVATTTLKVAEGAAEIVFADANAEVNVNNKLVWNVVDASGNKVALNSSVLAANYKDIDVKYVVLDKPEGAKVSVSDATVSADLISKGEGKMTLVSNKVGEVTVQVILKAEYQPTNAETTQVKYYTGEVVIPVGMDSFEDVVVMSIGSKEIVVNSDVKEMLCEAVIKDGRTMVPFRAGLEALGAAVDYVDGQVIAEMNGVKVVMTPGSKAYTVNGVAKVADVAPYLNVEASTTMVPASFVAAAFGINVDFTTNPDGTVADVIFAN